MFRQQTGTAAAIDYENQSRYDQHGEPDDDAGNVGTSAETQNLIGEHNYTNFNSKTKLNKNRRRTPKDRLLHTLSRLTQIAQALDEHQNVSKFSAALINAMLPAKPLLAPDKYREIFCKTNPWGRYKSNSIKSEAKKKNTNKVNHAVQATVGCKCGGCSTLELITT